MLKIRPILLLLFCFGTFYGQQTLTGRVLGEDLLVPMEIKIFDKDTTLIGSTDFDGYFQIHMPQNSRELIFAGLGYEWAKIVLPINCENLELILIYQGYYHYKSNRKIDRLRKKSFDMITKLHLQAYNIGLFKTEKPCINREFEPIKPELDKIAKHLKKLTKENKKNFELLKIGDTVRIPFSGSFRSDGTERTRLTVYSYSVEGENFDCQIQGVVTRKHKNRKGYFLTFKVTDTNKCKFESLVFDDKEVKIGEIFEHNMKYYKVITK